MNTRRTFWQIISFSPWLYALNIFLQLFRSCFLLLPGLIVFNIFNVLATNQPLGWNLWTLGALLVGAAVARITAMLSAVAMDATCMEYGNTLLRRNVFEQLLTKPGAQALPYSPGELISRFNADTTAITETIMYASQVIGVVAQVLFSAIVMFTINALITLVAFVPFVGAGVLIHVMSSGIQKYHRESRKTAGEVSSFIGEIFNTTQAI